MKKFYTLLLAMVALGVTTFAQTDTTKLWQKGFEFGLNFNAAQFSTNWQGGGVNNISFGGLLNAKANYKSKNGIHSWDNSLNLQYGIIRSRGQRFNRKSADLIFIDSKYGYKLGKKWYAFGGVNFLSQFAFGYEFTPDADPAIIETRRAISGFMAPGYLTEALGLEYKPKDWFFARLGLGATRQTFVLNQSVYAPTDSIRYGVERDALVRNEFGIQLNTNLNKDLVKDKINLQVRYLGFFNYETPDLDKIDHRFDIIFTAKITKYINVNLTTIFLYDFDQIAEWQNSQVLGIGLLFKR